MCLLVMALNAHPDFPFILFDNRDELPELPHDEPKLWPGGLFFAQGTATGGTWLALNMNSGALAVLTNVAGHWRAAQRRAKTRGEICKELVSSKPLEAVLRDQHDLGGFNVMWVNSIFADSLQVQYTSNCLPGNPPAVTVIGPQTVTGLGNDVLGDDHVKAAYVQRRVKEEILPRLEAIDPEEETVDQWAAHSVRLRDDLAQLFSERQVPCSSPSEWWAVFQKWLYFSDIWGGLRRMQPGCRLGVRIAARLSVVGACVSLGVGGAPRMLSKCIGVGAAVGFVCGWTYHLRMQWPYVSIPQTLVTRKYGTISQTAVFVDRSKKVHYYFRDTHDGLDGRSSQWKTFTFNAPKSTVK